MIPFNKNLIIFGLFIVFSCKDNTTLPYLGQTVTLDGVTQNHTIPDWKMFNQDSIEVTNKSLAPYVYVADFFFTSCPSICPRVAKEMLKIHDEFKDDPNVKIVSFTLDPKRDTPSKLKLYGDNLGIDHDKWWMLSGNKDTTLTLASSYFVAAFEDDSVPGGFDHSGKIILVDHQGHIRSFSEGTDPSETPRLIKDIKKLLTQEVK
ncbi:MAG TPA: SCO family protein [Saprospiraceae bacterium]|nr:SCO family protein [Saprospiraceae bacterium]